MKPVLIKTKYSNEMCNIQFGKYAADKSISMQLVCSDGEPFATATVCLPDMMKHITNWPTYTPHTGHKVVFIKNWSENEGILQSLIEAGVVSQPFAHIPTGYVYADACYLLVDSE